MVTMQERNAERPRYHRAEGGFTLIELMTVVGVIAVIVLLAVPNYLVWNAKANLREGTIELHSALSLARMAAMNRNTTVTVTVFGGGGAIVQATILDSFGAEVMRRIDLPQEITAWGGTSPVTFNSMGLRSGGPPGNITLTLTNTRGQTYSIQVAPSGKTKWCPAAVCP